MGKYVVDSSPGSLSGYLDLCEAPELVVDGCISCGCASDAWPEGVVLGMPSSSIITASVMDERMRYIDRAFEKVALNTSQSAFGRRLLQLAVGNQYRSIDHTWK